ncbi:MAG: hypothetical protein DRH06_07165 [Deltaproteobacteria bacterium]|nr:MAG: hypothetical protein DRH06_07165 [Deltaproteobacteria bacterium]
MSRKSFSLFIGLALLLAANSTVFASGFAIIEQSVSGLGTAFSSGAAATDASTLFFNPAGMTFLEGQQVNMGLHYIIPSSKFDSDETTNALGMELSGGDGGNGGETAVVPNLFYTNKINDRLSLGLGITAPFGMGTDYSREWVGRYHAKKSEVMTIDINPAIAYKLTDKLSVAVGVSAQYMDVTLSSMVDGGLFAYLGSGGAAPIGIVSNTDYDVFAENTADDWGFGFNLGAIYEFTPETRIGIAYRSEIKHKLKGHVDTGVPDALTNLNPALGGYFRNQDIHGDITLPATASVHAYSKITDRFALTADITWTDWSTFDELVIHFEGDGIANSDSTTTTENWDDSWRYSVGGTFQATNTLLLRTGFAYDETPIPDDYRTPRVAGEDRYWVTLGAGYQFTDSISMDLSYAHLFVDDSKMQKYASMADMDSEDFGRGTVVGEFDNSVDIISIGFSYLF